MKHIIKGYLVAALSFGGFSAEAHTLEELETSCTTVKCGMYTNYCLEIDGEDQMYTHCIES